MKDYQEAEVVEEKSLQRTLGDLAARGPKDVVQQAQAISKMLADIVNKQKLYNEIQGRKFVRVEGWTTLGAMLGVLPREVEVKELEDGSFEATVELIRASDGAVIGRASALCGVDEKDKNGKLTWGSRPKYARRSMAITRATGKAFRLGFSWIMTLAGYEATPAEEVPDEGFDTPKKTVQRKKVELKETDEKDELIQKIRNTILLMANEDVEMARRLLYDFTTFEGKDGEIVEGVTTTEGLKKFSLKRLQTTWGKIKKEAETTGILTPEQ